MILKKYKLKKTIHQFFPIDFIFFTNKFLNYWKPSVAIFIDSEIWPSMFLVLNKKLIPLILINARITNKTFKRWTKISFFSKNVFNKISVAYPQNLVTLKYLKKLKVNKIKFLGNLKFTESKNNQIETLNKLFLKKFKDRKIWCAASTHENEELVCANVHLRLKNKHKKLLTIIIPRHISRTKEIMSKIETLGLRIVNRSSEEKITDKTDIYLVDTYGETNKFFKICKTVFLGGSLIKHGGQNPIEAARMGSTILHGPYTDNFKDVYKLFRNKKISYKANNVNQLTKLVDKSIINSKNKKNKYLRIKKIGNNILHKTIKEIYRIIKNETQKT
jgi:3-deoxy-D-manno-octulosonic-acid transferase